MNRRQFRLHSKQFRTATIAIVMMAGVHANAQCPVTQLASGLQIPLGIVQSDQRNLLVSETGTPAPNTGRISIVGLNGTRRTVLDGLPSGINDVNEPSGPAGLFIRGRILYVAIGIGDSILAGPVPGTAVANPNPSSPIFSSVIAVHFSAHVEETTGGFTLTSAHHQALASGQRLILSNGSGDTIRVELIANFPDFTLNSPPPGNVRGSNPFDLIGVGDRLYVTDGGQNSLWQVDIATGAFSTLAVFVPVANPLPFGPPVVEAVPTGIAHSDGKLLVTLFRGFPFPPGASAVQQIDLIAGTQAQFITGLSSGIDVLPIRTGSDTDHLVLEFSADFLANRPGRLLRFSTPGAAPYLVANCLITPTSMVLDEKQGRVYVTELATGRVIALVIP